MEFDRLDPAAPLTTDQAMTLEIAVRTAYEERIPFVAVMNSAGADINEGIAALHGWGRVAAQLTRCSGVVPTFAILDGPAVSGPALLLGLMDFVVVTNDAYAFVNGPVMVRQFTGIEITKDELGSPATLERHTGLPVAIVADREAGAAYVEELLAYLPDHADAAPPRWPLARPARPAVPRGGRADPRVVHRQLRRAAGGRRDRRRRLAARGARPLGGQRGHRVRHHRRPPDRHHRQPADEPRRHARHPGLAEGGAVRGVLRRVQPAAR